MLLRLLFSPHFRTFLSKYLRSCHARVRVNISEAKMNSFAEKLTGFTFLHELHPNVCVCIYYRLKEIPFKQSFLIFSRLNWYSVDLRLSENLFQTGNRKLKVVTDVVVAVQCSGVWRLRLIVNYDPLDPCNKRLDEKKWKCCVHDPMLQSAKQ